MVVLKCVIHVQLMATRALVTLATHLMQTTIHAMVSVITVC